jgi:hypothetical protein
VRRKNPYAKVAGHNGKPRPEKKATPSQSQILVQLAAGAELFHDAEPRGYATIAVRDHRETMSLRGSPFKRWLSKAYYCATGKPPSAQAMADALGVIEARATIDGPKYDTYVRVAGANGKLYLDLADDEWNVVEVDASGWRVASNQPVRFRRPRGMLPLPVPTRGGRLDDLRRLLNIADDEQWQMIVAWVVASLRERGPYPILSLHGEQGSAKSTAARLLRNIIDPHRVPLRSEPREARDLAIAANNTWLLILDNLSSLPGWLSDALCRLSTGGGFGTRQLFTDEDEVLFDATRPIAVNGIATVGTRPDLLERSLLVELPAIPEERRRTEADVQAEFDAALPGILGALLRAVSGALRQLPLIRLDRLPRMADFCLWATAAEPALGWKPGSFAVAYTAARERAVETALEASPIGEPLRKLLDQELTGCWEGTASELLDRLRSIAGDSATKADDWPRRANSLSAHLRRIEPDLRRVGISIRRERVWRSRGKIIVLEKCRETSVPSVPSSPSGENRGFKGTDPRPASPAGSVPSVPSVPENNGFSEEFGPADDGTDGTDQSRPFSGDPRGDAWEG